MTIVMDATAAIRQGAGVGRFARGLLRGLAACDTRNDYVLLTTGSARFEPSVTDLPNRHRWLRLPLSERMARIAWQRVRVAPPATLFVPGAALFFTPDYALPPVGRVPGVLTVHDLSFLVHPECADAGLRRYLTKVVPRSVREAAAVVAVSHSTAAALTNLLGVPAERITVVPNGVDPRFRPATEEEQAALPGVLAERFALNPGYLLCVGTIEPRKNLIRLLQAYAALRRRMAGSGRTSPPNLVIAGREGWLYEPIFREVARLGLGRSVRFMTRVADADLAHLYRGSAAFVYPSIYEGFGIPPLEAMACGVPVVASSGGALQETLGDGALIFDPYDLEAIGHGMERILGDEGLRARLRARGTQRAAAYTWEGAASAALCLFERLAA